MARRVTAGIVGEPSVGTVLVGPTANITTAANLDISISPAGTGRFLINNNTEITAGRALRFRDADGSNFVGFTAPALAADRIWTLPATDGTSSQVLTTNGSGVLSWSNKDVNIVDQTTSSSTHYVTITTALSGTATTLNVSSTRMTFAPNTGTLTVSNLSAGNITETSSIVLKENVAPLSDALEKVVQLSGVNYVRKSSGKYEAGLIAEDVEKIAPELVDNTSEFKSIYYSRLTAYLIEAIKDLNKEIKQLKGTE